MADEKNVVEQLLIEIKTEPDDAVDGLQSARRETIKLADQTDELIGIMKKGDVQGAKVAASLEKIADRSLRAKEAAKAFDKVMKNQVNTFDKVADKVAVVNARLDAMGAKGQVIRMGMKVGFAAVTAGALAAAAAVIGLGVAVAGFVKDSMEAFVDSNFAASESAKELSKEWDELKVAVGSAAFAGDATTSIDALGETVERITKTVKESGTALNTALKTVISVAQGFIRVVSITVPAAFTPLLAVFDVVKLAVTALGAAWGLFIEGAATALNMIGVLSDDSLEAAQSFQVFTQALLEDEGLNSYTVAAFEAGDSIASFTADLGDAVIGVKNFSSVMSESDLLAGTFTTKEVRARLKLEAEETRRQDREKAKAARAVLAAERKKAAAAKAAQRARERAFDAILASNKKHDEMLIKHQEATAAKAAAIAKKEADILVAAQEKIIAAKLRRTVGDDETKRLADLTAQSKEFADSQDEISRVNAIMVAGLRAAEGAMVGFAVSLAEGDTSMKDMAKEMLSSFGDILVQMGTGILFTGEALAALFTGNPAAIIPAGAAMLAMGVLIKGLVGRTSLTEKDSGRSGGSASAASSDFAQSQDRFDRDQGQEGGDTVVVFIGQHQIREPLREITESMVRRGEVPAIGGAF